MRIIRVERPEWFARAACAGAGNDQWFPADGKGTEAARRQCADCQVVQQCHDYAMADPSLVGIWGGLSELQRDEIRRRNDT